MAEHLRRRRSLWLSQHCLRGTYPILLAVCPGNLHAAGGAEALLVLARSPSRHSRTAAFICVWRRQWNQYTDALHDVRSTLSLVLLAPLDTPTADGFDYRVLLLKRHAKSRTYDSAHVMPGPCLSASCLQKDV